MARALRGRQRLAKTAKPLKPNVMPYYVAAPERGHPSSGWYWSPAGVEHPAYLGFNHVIAELEILKLRERQQDADQAAA